MDPKLTFWCVLYYLGAFGTAWLPYETRCKTGRTSAKVRATMSHRTFRNERTRSTPLDPKLTFWFVLFYLGAFGTIWLPYETRCKTSRTSSKVRETKWYRNFSQRTYPILPIGPKTDILVRLILFLVHSGPLGCLTKLGAKQAELVQKFVPRSHIEHFATNAPDPPHWTL